MSLIRFGRGRELQFFRREDVQMRWDLPSATQMLNQFRPDSVAMETFRRQAAALGAAALHGKLSDDQVIQVIARQIVAGELVVALPQRQEKHLRLTMPEGASAAPEPAPATAPDRPEDEPTFDNQHNGVAQAAVLIAAAKAGFPFCEECARLAGLPPEKKQEAPALQAPRDSPEEEEKKELFWIEFELLDENGKPLPSEEYLVDLPDGSSRTGALDDVGFARLSNIASSGACKISFPKLDRDAWDFVTTLPAK